MAHIDFEPQLNPLVAEWINSTNPALIRKVEMVEKTGEFLPPIVVPASIPVVLHGDQRLKVTG